MSFIIKEYEDNHCCVSWSGNRFEDNDQFSAFLTNQVSNRLNDNEGRDQYEAYLTGLELTGLGKNALAEVLKQSYPKEGIGLLVKPWQKHFRRI